MSATAQPKDELVSGIDGRVALVTGAVGGLGKATSCALAALGAAVAIHHVGEQAQADELKAEIEHAGGEAITVEADVRARAEVDAMIEAVETSLGPLGLLVHSAGIGLERPFLQTSPEEWETVITTDLTGSFHCCQAAAKVMHRHGEGVIINISSQLGFKGVRNATAYASAKAGLTALTRCMAHELGPDIRVNAVAPGPVLTPFIAADDSEQWRANKLQGIVAGRLATPDDVVPAIVFLASDASRYFHGQTLHVNGGGVMS